MIHSKTGLLLVCDIAVNIPLVFFFPISSFLEKNNTIHYVHFNDLII